MTDNWNETQRKFRIAFLRRDGTAEEFAAQIPATKDTAYRIARCEVQRPSRALRKAVEELVGAASEDGRSAEAGSED
jgi:hypothetical protein